MYNRADLSNFVNRHEVRVSKSGRCPRLAVESLAGIGCYQYFRPWQLEHHETTSNSSLTRNTTPNPPRPSLRKSSNRPIRPTIGPPLGSDDEKVVTCFSIGDGRPFDGRSCSSCTRRSRPPELFDLVRIQPRDFDRGRFAIEQLLVIRRQQLAILSAEDSSASFIVRLKHPGQLLQSSHPQRGAAGTWRTTHRQTDLLKRKHLPIPESYHLLVTR